MDRDDEDGDVKPLPESDGLVRLRRRSDWAEEPRPGDEAAEAAYRAALTMATATLAEHDGGTASHSDDVVTLTLAVAEELGIEGRDRAYLLAAAELHDIGKVGVPAQILSKPGPLDEQEWEVIREHTLAGERILGAVPELREVARIVRHCHERWDGEGYPDGLRGEQIPLSARIVFCADAYHAIRGDRPYRRGRSAGAALTEVKKHAGTQFDPAVVKALARVAARLRERRSFGMAPLITGGRSQRLAALLLTLALGGSAFAATGVWNPTGGEASDKVEKRAPAAKPSGGAPATDKPAPARNKAAPAGGKTGDPAGGKTGGPVRGKRPGNRTGATGASEGDAGATPPAGAAPNRSHSKEAKRVDRGSAGGKAPGSRRASQTESPSPKRTATSVPAPAPPTSRAPTPTRAPVRVPAPVLPTPPADDDDGDDDDDDDDGNSGRHHGHGNGHQGHGNGHHGRGRGRHGD